MSHSDAEDSPLPTPTLPLYLEHAFHSFSFGGPQASSSSASSFPDYCLPRRSSGSMGTNGIGGISEGGEEEENEEGGGGEGRGRSSDEALNPSPVYPALSFDGSWVEQTASTPTTERGRFEYPLPSSSTSSTPFSFSPPSLLHPHTSPFYNPSSHAPQPPPPPPPHPLSPSLNFNLNLNLTSQNPLVLARRISLTRSHSSTTRPHLPKNNNNTSATQTHFHPPPNHRFHPDTTPAPIPPSLKNHPALRLGGRRGSLPAALSLEKNQQSLDFSPPPPLLVGTGIVLGGKKGLSVSEVAVGVQGTFACSAAASHAKSSHLTNGGGGGSRGGLGAGGRRGSLAEKGLRERVAEQEGRERSFRTVPAVGAGAGAGGGGGGGRPRLERIPSFGRGGEGR